MTNWTISMTWAFSLEQFGTLAKRAAVYVVHVVPRGQKNKINFCVLSTRKILRKCYFSHSYYLLSKGHGRGHLRIFRVQFSWAWVLRHLIKYYCYGVSTLYTLGPRFNSSPKRTPTRWFYSFVNVSILLIEFGSCV